MEKANGTKALLYLTIIFLIGCLLSATVALFIRANAGAQMLNITNTPQSVTSTPVPPTDTPVVPTKTLAPTKTAVPPTDTPVPPTETAALTTPPRPSPTPQPPVETKVSTDEPTISSTPTNQSVPSATPQPTPSSTPTQKSDKGAPKDKELPRTGIGETLILLTIVGFTLFLIGQAARFMRSRIK